MPLRRTYSVERVPAWLRPWWLEIAYWEFDALTAVCYPLGIHFIVRAWHRFNPSIGERKIAAWRARSASR